MRVQLENTCNHWFDVFKDVINKIKKKLSFGCRIQPQNTPADRSIRLVFEFKVLYVALHVFTKFHENRIIFMGFIMVIFNKKIYKKYQAKTKNHQCYVKQTGSMSLYPLNYIGLFLTINLSYIICVLLFLPYITFFTSLTYLNRTVLKLMNVLNKQKYLLFNPQKYFFFIYLGSYATNNCLVFGNYRTFIPYFKNISFSIPF